MPACCKVSFYATCCFGEFNCCRTLDVENMERHISQGYAYVSARGILGALAKWRKATIGVMSVCPSACNNSASCGRILIKPHI